MIRNALRCAFLLFSVTLLFVESLSPLHAQAPTKADIDRYAMANGFPNSDYPYYERTNGCGSEGWKGLAVRDTWGQISFVDACNAHDRCFMIPGSNVNACDDNFYGDVRTACERDSYYNVRGVRIRDPGLLAWCYNLATTYYAALRAASWNWHNQAQPKAKQYKQLVDDYLKSRQVNTNALVCITNATQNDVKYAVRWGDDGQWESFVTAPNHVHYFSWTYALGSRSSPSFWISYDSSFAAGFQGKLHSLNKYATNGTDCSNGYNYVFKVSGQGIQLYDSK